MPSCLARCAAASGSLPWVRLPSESRIDRGGRALAVLAAARREAVERRVQRVAGGGAAVGLQGCERGLDRSRSSVGSTTALVWEE